VTGRAASRARGVIFRGYGLGAGIHGPTGAAAAAVRGGRCPAAPGAVHADRDGHRFKPLLLRFLDRLGLNKGHLTTRYLVRRQSPSEATAWAHGTIKAGSPPTTTSSCPVCDQATLPRPRPSARTVAPSARAESMIGSPVLEFRPSRGAERLRSFRPATNAHQRLKVSAGPSGFARITPQESMAHLTEAPVQPRRVPLSGIIRRTRCRSSADCPSRAQISLALAPSQVGGSPLLRRPQRFAV
jgi:hypothetical protein